MKQINFVTIKSRNLRKDVICMAVQQMPKEAEQIRAALEEKLNSELSATYEVSLKSVAKNNGVELIGLMIKDMEFPSVMPTIYIDGQIDSIKAGDASISEVVSEVARQYMLAPKEAVREEASKIDFEHPQAHLEVKIVNFEKNREFLKDVPFRKIEDLAVIPMYRINAEASFVIKNEHLPQMGLSASECVDLAIQKVCEEGFSVISMADMLRSMMGDDAVDTIGMGETPNMLVITNEAKIFGAAGAYIDMDVRAEIKDMFGGQDFYILPSSIHECLAVPAAMANVDDLTAMVREVNATQVSETEYLSDSVYYVDKQLHISIASQTQAEADNQAHVQTQASAEAMSM